MTITEIDDGVFSATHSIAEGKNAIIFGRHRALAVDCGLLQAEGETMAQFIRDRGFAADRLALTHCHNDHLLGGKAFAAAEVFAHVNSAAVIRRHLPGFARYWKMSEEETADRLLRPTVVFGGDLAVDLGGKVVRFLSTPGHSEDHVSLYLESQQVLIAGDAIVNSILPTVTDGDSRVLQATLARLRLLPIRKLLPGHGSLISGEANVREAIDWTITYLEKVRACVREVIGRGQSWEMALAAANYGKLVGDRLPQEKMQQRHSNAVRKIFDEEATTAFYTKL